MTRKKTIKILVDCLMLLTLLFLMTYSLIGEATHEALGIAMFVLMTVHQILNRDWYQRIAKGRYSAARILMLATNILMILLMLLQVTAGITLSKHVFAFLGIETGIGAFRLIHLATPYWLFLLVSMHLGFHWKMILAMIRNKHGNHHTKAFSVGWTFAGVISGYGIYALIRRQFPDYMFLWNQYSFFDFEEPLFFFLLDYVSVMVLFATFGCGLMTVLPKISKRGGKM